MNPFRLLDSPADVRLMGAAGQAHIQESAQGELHLMRWVQLVDTAISDQAPATQQSVILAR